MKAIFFIFLWFLLSDILLVSSTINTGTRVGIVGGPPGKPWRETDSEREMPSKRGDFTYFWVNLGLFLMYMFLAVIGASSDLIELFASVPGILAFATITLLVHLLVSLLGGKLLKVSLKEIMIASCAHAGGPSVSAPMAVSFGMKEAVTPAILIGLPGYVIGTFLGVGVGAFLQ
jgi:hypothetical protein